MRKIFELIKDITGNNKDAWDDPEFGPTPSDPTGSKSMYIAENDITPGCPIPTDLMWARPNDILSKLILEGQTDLQGAKAEVFDGGAASNDVIQSKFLGNCWFISALSIIAQDDTLLKGNFEPNKNNVEEISDKEVAEMSMGVYPPVFHFTR